MTLDFRNQGPKAFKCKEDNKWMSPFKIEMMRNTQKSVVLVLTQ
jgi:hypothetical protein